MSDDRSSPGLGEGEQESRGLDAADAPRARPENVAVVWHVLGAFAEALQLPDPVIEDMCLAVTEACTNVVRHAYADGEPGPVQILIRPEGDELLVVVSDEAAAGPAPTAAPAWAPRSSRSRTPSRSSSSPTTRSCGWPPSALQLVPA